MRALALSIVLLLACDSDEGSVADTSTTDTAGDTTAATGLDLRDLSAAMSHAICQHMIACCTDEELERELSWLPTDQPTTPTRCEDNVQLDINFDVAVFGQGVEDGRIRYDGAKAEACVAAIAALGCSGEDGRFERSFGRGIASCDAMAAPLVDDGGACSSHRECKSALCNAQDEAQGVCIPLASEGQACIGVGNWSCRPGLYCAGTCKPLVALGAPCEYHIECGDDRLCGQDGCEAERLDGAACDNDEQCTGGSCRSLEAFGDLVCGRTCDGK